MPVSSFSSKDPFRREENDDKTQDSSPPLPSSGWTTTTSSVPQSFWSTSTTDHANNNSDSISPESGSSSSSSSSSSIRMALGGPIQEEEEHNHSNGSNVLSGPIPMERVSDNAHSSSSLAWVSTTTLNASWYARNQYPSTILEEEDQPQQPPTVARQKSPPRSPYALRVRGGGGIGQAPEGDFEEEEEEDYTNLHDDVDTNSQTNHSTPASPFLKSSSPSPSSVYFVPLYTVTHCLEYVSLHWLHWDCHVHSRAMASATWIGFWALLHVTCATYVLTPMRDAIALAVGVDAMPQLTLASTVLAFCSSVPIGWLFEAPDPSRRLVWKRMGLTRGETQGTSLALFYRCFALILISYAIGFPLLEWIHTTVLRTTTNNNNNSAMMMDAPHEERLLHEAHEQEAPNENAFHEWVSTVLSMVPHVTTMVSMMRQGLYIAFFLVVHLMKLHSLSLVWGVTTEAMEYEDVARQKQQQQAQAEPMTDHPTDPNTTATSFPKPITRLQRLGLIGFGGTLGGILGSVLASTLAQILYLSGLLVLAAVLLEISAELSIELGRIMQQHWVEQQEELFQQQQQQQSSSSSSTMPLDTSIRRTVSLGSMKRVASGNSLNRVRSATDLKSMSSSTDATSPSSPGVLMSSTPSSPLRNNTSASVSPHKSTAEHNNNTNNETSPSPSTSDKFNDNTFFQRLLRGVTTILRSRFLMAIFTYNALYASTTVLLSFQRAALVANRNATASAVASNTAADLAFLANINMASSVAIFALQASGAGALLAQLCGPRGTLALMPLIRLAGVLALAWWHHTSHGQPPNLVVFLVVDECCKIMNLAVAKPVRESLWRGLSNEARYEAKPIVDTLANRWGGGSAAFLVSTLNKLLDVLIGPDDDTDDETGTILSSSSSRLVLGCPPLLFLCIVLSAWWAAVSIDLGQIRKSIDLELKKRQ